MGKSKVTFGDKIFIYGQFLQNIYEFEPLEYNSIMGYMTVGGFIVDLKETDVAGASVPGLVADFGIDGQLTPETPFSNMEMVDVTDKLSLRQPLPYGCKVWAPTLRLSV